MVVCPSPGNSSRVRISKSRILLHFSSDILGRSSVNFPLEVMGLSRAEVRTPESLFPCAVDYVCAGGCCPVASSVECQLADRRPSVFLQNVWINSGFCFSIVDDRPDPEAAKQPQIIMFPPHSTEGLMFGCWWTLPSFLHTERFVFLTNNSTSVWSVHRIFCQWCCGTSRYSCKL